jgi:hypothetical protein
VILGAGPGGGVALNTLLKHGKRVALVEQEVIGGECTNWGCIPSKTLLRPTELRGQAMRKAGIHPPMLDFERLAEYRDYMVSNHDDSDRIGRYEAPGFEKRCELSIRQEAVNYFVGRRATSPTCTRSSRSGRSSAVPRPADAAAQLRSFSLAGS